MEHTLTQLYDTDPMLDDIKVVARCINIWKSLPASNPKDVWSLDGVLHDVQISSLVFHPYLPLQIPNIKSIKVDSMLYDIKVLAQCISI
nr:replication protein A 70 kDa DNA-binding subunit B [Tanacetum cinerariifolium]